MSPKRVRSPTRDPSPSRSHLRAIKAFGERVSVGIAVIGDAAKPKQAAVINTAKKFGRSERYVWGTVKLGSKTYAAALAILEKEASRNKRPRPRTVAALFLLRELRNEPRPMKEVAAFAHDKNIAASTLRRACNDLSVKARRIGGQDGYWTWELPLNVKKYYGIED